MAHTKLLMMSQVWNPTKFWPQEELCNLLFRPLHIAYNWQDSPLNINVTIANEGGNNENREICGLLFQKGKCNKKKEVGPHCPSPCTRQPAASHCTAPEASSARQAPMCAQFFPKPSGLPLPLCPPTFPCR